MIAICLTMPNTTNKDYAALARQIHNKRVRLKLTQAQFARMIGVRQQQVSEWEQGKRLRLLSVAFRLARVLAKKR